MNIETITDHVITTLKTVTELNGAVGLAVGGKDIDPDNEGLPRPGIWVTYMGDDNESPSFTSPSCDTIKLNFELRVLVDYDHEKDLKENQLPLLHKIVNTLRGTSPILGIKWIYEGQYLTENNGKRMVWIQNYSVTAPL